MHRLRVATVLFALWPAGIFGQAADRMSRQWMHLSTGCAPVALIAGVRDNDSTLAGLADRAIYDVMRDRLEAARLYRTGGEDLHPMLTAEVWASGDALLVTVRFVKPVTDTMEQSPIWGSPVWVGRALGSHGNDPGFVLDAVLGITDEFLAKYLAVNGADCDRGESSSQGLWDPGDASGTDRWPDSAYDLVLPPGQDCLARVGQTRKGCAEEGLLLRADVPNCGGRRQPRMSTDCLVFAHRGLFAGEGSA